MRSHPLALNRATRRHTWQLAIIFSALFWLAIGGVYYV